MKKFFAIALPISTALFFACSDGSDGENGIAGADGADGTSCITELKPDSSGYFVICGKDTVGTIHNGVDGLPGTDGKDGAKGPKGDKGDNGKDGIQGAAGEDGKNCTVRDTVDADDPTHTGVFISCEDSTEKVIWNVGDRNSDNYLEKIGICGDKIYDTTIKTCINEILYAGLDMGKTNWAYLPETSTYGLMVDERDMQVYKTVVIGTQTWFAENLNYDLDNPKDDAGNDIYTWSWCYQNDKANCDIFGRLYTWAATMDSIGQGSRQGICPEGWHVPSQAEWTTLITYVGGVTTAGTKLKSADLWNDESKGTNDYGFTVLPAGLILPDGTFPEDDVTTTFWASDDPAEDLAYRMYFNSTTSSDATHRSYKPMGSAVRCIKN